MNSFLFGLVVGALGIMTFSNRSELVFIYNRARTSNCRFFTKFVLGGYMCWTYFKSNDPLVGVFRNIPVAYNPDLVISRCKGPDGEIYTTFIEQVDSSDRSRYFACVELESPLHQYFGTTRIDVTPISSSSFPPASLIPGFVRFERVGTDGEVISFTRFEELKDYDEPCE